MSEVKELIKQNEVSDQTALMIEEHFSQFIQKTTEWKSKAEALVVTDSSQVEEMTQAREARLVLKKIRIEADKVRKDLKKDSLAYGKAVQSVYNLIESQIKPIEQHLEKQENFAKYQEIEMREKLRSERSPIAEEVREYIPANVDLGFLTEQEFDRMIKGAKLTKQAEEEAAAKAEQERLEEERKQAEERKAIEEENARLKAEAEAREKEEADRKARIEEDNKLLRIERAKAIQHCEGYFPSNIDLASFSEEDFEKFVLATEKTKIEIESAKEKEEEAAREKKAREKAEEELKAKHEEEARRIAAEKEKEEFLNQQSDKAKLTRISERLEHIELPEMTSENGKAIVKHIKNMLNKLAHDTLSQAKKF